MSIQVLLLLFLTLSLLRHAMYNSPTGAINIERKINTQKVLFLSCNLFTPLKEMIKTCIQVQ